MPDSVTASGSLLGLLPSAAMINALSVGASRAAGWITANRRVCLLVLSVLLICLVGGVALRHFDEVPGAIEALGMIGPVALFVLIALAPFFRAPGVLLVGLAIGLYGPVLGGGIALTGLFVGAVTSFLAFRGLVGFRSEPPSEGRLARWAIARWAFSQLEDRPVLAVALLRCTFWVSPVLSGLLALSPISVRSYVVGSALGLAPAVIALASAFSSLRNFFE